MGTRTKLSGGRTSKQKANQSKRSSGNRKKAKKLQTSKNIDV